MGGGILEMREQVGQSSDEPPALSKFKQKAIIGYFKEQEMSVYIHTSLLPCLLQLSHFQIIYGDYKYNKAILSAMVLQHFPFYFKTLWS